MVVGEASIHNIMGGMESTGGVRLHNHKRKLKQRFDIIRKLGQGTYGKVQLGINKETSQEVAIKTIKKCKIETEADLIRIRREIQIMSSVQHPNIIHIYEVFENREKMVLVMEYAAGGELYDYLSERKVLKEEEARRIFRQIATAVFYCHKHKICHRDLKLENILLDETGNAKIADFGLSNVFDERRLLSTFCGSPLYASPEIVKGTPYHGPEVDCWSLGVLLYTLVYGAMPFDGSNFKRLVKQISQSDYFEPKKPSPASPLIKDMLTVAPGRRADIERICTHWWVNEGYEQNCLEIAEDLAAQTPVRLDLLLSLVPQSASADKLVVGDDQQTQSQQQSGRGEASGGDGLMVPPARCHSIGSLMELEQNGSERRIRELVEEEPPPAPSVSDAKRKLETTPSSEETNAAAAKKKERPGSAKKDGVSVNDKDHQHQQQQPRPYRATVKHHSAPLPNPILEEPMEIDPTITLPMSETVDLKKIQEYLARASSLEVSEQKSNEASPVKERSKTPVRSNDLTNHVEKAVVTNGKVETSDEVKSPIEVPASPEKSVEPKIVEQKPVPESPKKAITPRLDEEVKKDAHEANVPKDKASPVRSSEVNDAKVPVQKENDKPTEKVSEAKSPKKVKSRALSLDPEILSEEAVPKPSTERRRSKIFETAEKFNQLASPVEPEKPKKIFIPGVNVGGAKLAFERKASLSSATVPQTIKAPVAKVIIDVPTTTPTVPTAPDKKPENDKATTADVDLKEKERKREEEKKRAVDIITGALGKPPMQRRLSGSPPVTPLTTDPKKLGLRIPLGPNDLRNATVTVSTPTETKFPLDSRPELQARGVPVSNPSTPVQEQMPPSTPATPATEEPKKCSSKVEITLKSATLPRPRKTSRAEITLSGRPSDSAAAAAFRSEVEAKVDAFPGHQRLLTQRSEVAFPVSAAPQPQRSSSLEPETRAQRGGSVAERIIPISVQEGRDVPLRAKVHSTTPPPHPPILAHQRSSSLSRQSTAESDSDSALGGSLGAAASVAGPEPIRKSPREYIIPIAVEGGGYVTPRSGSLEPEASNGSGTPTSVNPQPSRSARLVRPRRMGSLLSDASEDESSPFSSMHRDNEDLLQRHMHRLRSSRPSRQAPEHADSLSSGEEDDDDGFELLTAENLFSTLLSRVRSLTQRLNVDDGRGGGFPSGRLLHRLGSNSSQGFWGVHEPLSSYESYFECETQTTRISDSQFRRSVSRDHNDRFARKEPSAPSSPGSQQNSSGTRTPSRDSLFETGSNTLPRAKYGRSVSEQYHQQQQQRQQQQAALAQASGILEQHLTPGLARRLSRQFIERTRQPLPRSPSLPRESALARQASSSLERIRSRSHERGLGLGSSSTRRPVLEHQSRRSISLFDDDDDDDEEDNAEQKSVGPRQQRASLSLDGYYGDEADDTTVTDESVSCRSIATAPDSVIRAIQEEQPDEEVAATTLATTRTSSCGELSGSRELRERLLAAESLIKESKMRNNLGGYGGSANPNLMSSYRELDKCDGKESLAAISEAPSCGSSSSSPSSVLLTSRQRRSCIPSLRLRSGSLGRDRSLSRERSRLGSQEALSSVPSDRSGSLLSKLFRSSGSSPAREVVSTTASSSEGNKEKQPQQSKARRISRFLRPDFFDTPREESQYVKEKEAQKAAENERRKSRFMRRKQAVNGGAPLPPPGAPATATADNSNSVILKSDDDRSKKTTHADEKQQIDETKVPTTRHSFLQSLEKKLEKFRSTDDGQSKTTSKPATIIVEKLPQQPQINETKVKTKKMEEEPQTTEAPKRASSLSKELSNGVREHSPSKSRVNSVLGLFKGSSTSEQNGSSTTGRSAQVGSTGILGRLRKSAYKGSRSDGVLSTDNSPTVNSKIPALKQQPAKKVSDKTPSSSKSLTAKDKTSKEASPASKKPLPAIERLSKSLSRSPDKSTSTSTTSTSLSSSSSTKQQQLQKKRSDSLHQIAAKAKSPERAAVDATGLPRPKKRPEPASGVNGKPVKPKKSPVPCAKPKEPAPVAPTSGSDKSDSSKKKRIVRVVRKVVKKSPEASKSSPSSTPVKQNGVNMDKQQQSSKSPEPSQSSSSPSSPSSSLLIPSKPQATLNGQARHGPTAPVVVEAEPVVLNKPSRDKLRLDLSKIPQHSFRTTTTPPRRESPRSESADVTPSQPQQQPPMQRSRSDEAPVGYIAVQPEQATRASLRLRVVPRQPQPPSSDEPMSPAEDTESLDSWSVCSAEVHTPSSSYSSSHHLQQQQHPAGSTAISPTRLVSSPQPPSQHASNIESIVDRIRRRSFYSRFNDRSRRKAAAAPSLQSPVALGMSSSMTLPRRLTSSSSFHGPRDYVGSSASGRSCSVVGRRQTAPDKCYSMYVGGDEGSSVVSRSSAESPSGCSSSGYEPLKRYQLSPSLDYYGGGRRYHSAELAPDSASDLCGGPSARNSSSPHRSSSLAEGMLTEQRARHASRGGFEPKSVEYYEELLAPNNMHDYLNAGQRSSAYSPVSRELHSKYENGYHNGDLHYSPDKWRNHSSELFNRDAFCDSIHVPERVRKVSQCISEPDDLSSSLILDQRITTSTAD
ncbi:hypothetical protein QAD02_008507 [Eretmocerus hayati]|uniref:Uncharacterized protein n=1 Tax=Eretmocerus hayati TaxID=131215 RepID=A0ACC2N6M1_9HYME|nr:hypothetical protein QAD02_008507 [Eretmocerus hayati]